MKYIVVRPGVLFWQHIIIVIMLRVRCTIVSECPRETIRHRFISVMVTPLLQRKRLVFNPTRSKDLTHITCSTFISRTRFYINKLLAQFSHVTSSCGTFSSHSHPHMQLFFPHWIPTCMNWFQTRAVLHFSMWRSSLASQVPAILGPVGNIKVLKNTLRTSLNYQRFSCRPIY